ALGLPKKSTYYKAAILESAIKLHAPKNTFQWVDMEHGMTRPNLITNLMWTLKPFRPRVTPLYPTLPNHSIDSANLGPMAKKFCTQAPLTALETISPWLSLKPRTSRGITRIKDFCSQSPMSLMLPVKTLESQRKLQCTEQGTKRKP
ncbi:Hypothetical predicted protein, partial [Pelobates cultripes]